MMCKSGYIVILWATILASVGFLHAQDNVILQFTGQDQNGGYVKLDRVLVENISKHWQEVLYYPDTNFIMGVTGVEEIHGGGEGVRLAQNVPNPFDGVTDFSLYLPNSSKVLLEVYDLNGKISAAYTGSLDPGNHQFRAWLDNPQTYLLQAHTVDGMVQIKMVNTGHAGRSSIEYLGKVSVPDAGKADKGGTNQPFSFGDVMLYKGFVHLAGTEYESAHVLKEQYNSELIPLIFTLPLPTVTTDAATNITTSEAQLNGSVTGVAGYPVLERGFVFADNASLSGAVEYSAGAGSGQFHHTVSNLQVYTHYFYQAYAKTEMGISYGILMDFSIIPPFYCGIDSVTDYDGNHYPTVEIGQQCWMKENLSTTHYTDGTEIPLGTTLSENTAYRHCPNNNSANVPIYGYLYNWTAVMHGASSSNANPSGVQGICPPGWHVPSDAEFEQLINYVSSQSQYGCGGNSSNILKALSSATGWNCTTFNPCNAGYNILLNNATGFSATPAGYAGTNICETGSTGWGTWCCFRSTTEYINGTTGAHGAGSLEIVNLNNVLMGHLSQCYGLSVRCLLNDSGVDSSITVTPLVTTAKIEDITSTSASTSGFVSGSGGTPVTSRGVCWNTSPNPTVRDSHTSDGNSTGRFSSNMSGLTPGTTYYVRAYATNSVGTAYGEQQIFTTTHPINDSILIDSQTCPGADTVTDYDGNIYHTVQIGNQCWMRENLRTTHYTDGNEIPAGTTTSETVAYRYASYGGESSVPTYGYLYNWVAVMHGDSASNANPSGVQGICPTGWHVPSQAEWTQLQDYVGSQSQYLCGSDSTKIAKALASHIWCHESVTNTCAIAYNVSTNNATGFSALPAGYYFGSIPYGQAYIWSSNQCAFYLRDTHATVSLWEYPPSSYGGSVRCLRD